MIGGNALQVYHQSTFKRVVFFVVKILTIDHNFQICIINFMKKRHLLTILLTPFLIFALTFGGIYFWWQEQNKPVNPNLEQEKMIIVPKGAGTIEIANLLKEQNLIKNPLAFRLLVMQKGIDQQLQAGSFRLTPSMSLEAIAVALTSGKEDFWVTVPEGKRNEEVAWIVKKEFDSNGVAFDVDNFLLAADKLQGYLYPDTYLIPKSIDEKGVVSLVRLTFDQKIPDEQKIRASQHKLSFAQVLILASLVEREAKFDIDRPKIAAVLLNRLAVEMPLQIDATVQYAKANAINKGSVVRGLDWWPQVLRDDLNYYESPFNTYLNSSLPPQPICNPGQKAIEAVLDPDTHNYLYYVSQPNGTTYYATTLEEHEANIAKYLR